MARSINRLSARGVEALKVPGVYADGGNLYLRVKGPTAKSWVFIATWDGRRRELGFGATHSVSLARAREKAQEARAAIADGHDPTTTRRAALVVPVFGAVADEFITARSPSVRSVKSIARWERCIGKGGYAESLRSLKVDQITTADVLAVLRPLWQSHPSTSGLLRGYIEAVLNMAKVAGHRSGENPAAWTGHLALILPARGRLSRGHHAALPYIDIPKFMGDLRSQDSLASCALQLTILCATRTSETLNAKWDEFDFQRGTWTIGSGRMKAGKEHRVPLSTAAIELLGSLDPGDGYVFPGRKPGRPLSNMAMEMVLRRMKLDVTVHGFRSTFRDWAGETTDTPREVCEAALAHTIGNSVELSYRRGDALEKRRFLMETWGAYCSDSPMVDKTPELARSA